MMTTLSSYVRRGRHTLGRLWLDPRIRSALRWGGWFLAGLAFSAASLRHSSMPLAMSLVLALTGWPAFWATLGGVAGYLWFWQAYGLQGAAWMALGLTVTLCLGQGKLVRQQVLLLPAAAALIVAATGLAFQFWELDNVRLGVYLLRILLGAGAVLVFRAAREHRDPVTDWLLCGLGILALAQIEPLGLCLGFVAAGAVGTVGAFPAAALAGLALDLALVTPVPMTAVLSLLYLLRLAPWANPWVVRLAPGAVFVTVCALTGIWDLWPLPALILGGVLGRFLPQQQKIAHRRGRTGVAQVRLELAAGVLAEAERQLLEVPEVPIDEAAIISRCAERACGGCPCRKNCRDRDAVAAMDPKMLHRTVLTPGDLGVSCRKNGRVLYELHRSQEQLRAIRGSRERQTECRTAVVQQYQFLSAYLQELSDSLSRRERDQGSVYQVRVSVFANRPAADNGDRCLRFAGPEGQYFVILCDGMGTGLGAVDEARTAGKMLQDLLRAGFPAEHALQSLNSLCALRGRAGAVTVDLAQIKLATGRVTLYKWGAAPSYLLTETGAEKLGAGSPPPGLSVDDACRATRLLLRPGQTLALLSDGVAGADLLRRWDPAEETAGELVTRLLERQKGSDDATVALVTVHTA